MLRVSERPRLRRTAALLPPPRLKPARLLARRPAPQLPALLAPPVEPEVRPNPYVDYRRRYTEEGGIAITYKDLDARLWRTVLRFVLWLAVTSLGAWFAIYHSPLASPLLNGIGVVVLAVVNWLILFAPVEVYRSIEIRPDCMIIEGTEIFWRDQMELGFPSFRPTPEGHLLLCGTYGTRFVEYLTLRRFDELDRSPEVFVAHLNDAMRQLWSGPGR